MRQSTDNGVDFEMELITKKTKMDKGLDEAKKLLKELTDDERMELFGNYCKCCGCDDPSCQCWNDE